MINMDAVTVGGILAVVSFMAGFIDSIAGGGGLLLLPAILLAGIPPQFGLGTNKFSSTFGTGVALLNYIQNKKVIWRIGIVGVPFTLLGAFIGTQTILLFSNETVGKIILLLLPFAMIGTLMPRCGKEVNVEFSKPDVYLKVPLICLALGFYDGFFGPGTGSFLIIAFYFLIGVDLVRASATAKVFNLASNLGALTLFLINGKVLLYLGIPMALANIAGNYLGSSLAIKKGAGLIKVFLILALVILFVSLIWKYFSNE